jgi:hypothetical protein
MADTKWKPGQSGNPNGRPKKENCLTDILKSKVDAEDLAERLINAANNGDMIAMKYIYDRIDGRPKESVDIDSRSDVNMNMVVEIVRPKNADS